MSFITAWRLLILHHLQVNECLSNAGDYDKTVDYSMRQDTSRVMQNGRRIARCMIRYDLTSPESCFPSMSTRSLQWIVCLPAWT
jgi:hypothetical protein